SLRPRHGRVRSAAIWHFMAMLLITVGFISTVWGAPAEKAFVGASANTLTIWGPPTTTILGLGLNRVGMLFIGFLFVVAGVMCMLIGFAHGARQRRQLREEAYAGA